MEFRLDDDTRKKLNQLRRQERDRKRYVKLSVLLSLDSGYSPGAVADILGVDVSTVYRYLEKYKGQGLDAYLADHWVPFSGYLSESQLAVVKEEVSSNLYLCAREVGAWIGKRFGIRYHAKQVVKILHKLGFSHKKTELVPGKASFAAQGSHIRDFHAMDASKGEGAKIFFNDGVHPQYNTKPEYGWILKGETFEIPPQAGRRRINITGAVNAHGPVEPYGVEATRVNCQSTIALWEKIEKANPGKRIIHICDNARYYHGKVLKEWLGKHPLTTVVHLPPYSPNPDPIERVWKLLKKEMINSWWYDTFGEFRDGVMAFFENPTIWEAELRSCVTLNFSPKGY